MSLLGSGTSPNESLHAEINRWFKNQPEIFSATLNLQLEINLFGKLLSHNASLYRPSLRQLSQIQVLTIGVTNIVFTEPAWNAFSLSEHDKDLVLANDAVRQKIRAHRLLRKKPAGSVQKKPGASLPSASTGVARKKPAKRTPFALKRTRRGFVQKVRK